MAFAVLFDCFNTGHYCFIPPVISLDIENAAIDNRCNAAWQ